MAKLAEIITYVPGQHDPSHVKWCGHTFQANVAKEIKGDPDGTSSEKLNAQLIESARNNPHFVVGEGAKATRASRDKMPKDAKGYRAYFVNWLKEETFETPEDLIGRFARDRELQAKCDVGPDDFAQIGELFDPRLHELAKACDLAEAQIAAVWVNHGYNQLPW
ncbi:hypothetical protein [Bradyrhizobium betae]|uniref:Uncharacterized protein n=1 Tax=Bradyrhizobium betae TaxID=244734 RepID=A0A5P6NYK7_9BRAD|nr:hypothetical protein [Bradyrhizobium betae]MCS3725503.1 hypothetical protein [Bradyrhizobium betae]QFI71209.1 hypothetical protein F8237_01765 [Bradyrhizobium betae]